MSRLSMDRRAAVARMLDAAMRGAPDEDGTYALAGEVRVSDLRSSVRVTVTARGVDAWSFRWPCSGLVGAIGATFDAHGDLDDVNGDDGCDGDAFTALMTDACGVALARIAPRGWNLGTPATPTT